MLFIYKQTPEVNGMIVLNGSWQVIESTEYGDILAVDDGDKIRVSFHEDISEDDVRKVLTEKGIKVGYAAFEDGEGEGETVAFFAKLASQM
jgi:hypothetical protein